MLIVGAKGFASEVADTLIRNGELDLFMFDDVTPNLKQVIDQIPVLNNEEEVIKLFYGKLDRRFTIAVGGPQNREYLYRKFVGIGGIFTTVICKSAHINIIGTNIGEGANICSGSIITSNVTVGKGLLLNINASISHDCEIADFVEISPGARITGNCKIGSFVSLGSNATILPGIEIGKNVTIGAGSVVTKSIESNSLVVGIPGKVVRRLPELNVD